ncbi:HNH endonuclease [Sellimonas catena]|uniref:HNH endonuclease n=1 Tax=Sellimonas catena TaxID=2994035 RepID=UPI00386A975F
MTDQEVKKIYNSCRWQQVRDRVLLRDRYECQDCIQRLRMAAVTGERLFGEDAKIRRATQVHHIKELRSYPDLAFEEDNLISLCTRCHNIRHGRQPTRFVKKKKTVTEERW